MRTTQVIIGLLASAGLLAYSSGRLAVSQDSAAARTSLATMVVPPSTTVATNPTTNTRSTQLEVSLKAQAAAVAAAAERARRQAGADSTCATPAPLAEVPEAAQSRCDDVAGWRTFAWVGMSGDGIIRLERNIGPSWVAVYLGPLCVNGVASATPAQLVKLGVPSSLAEAWGYPASACQP